MYICDYHWCLLNFELLNCNYFLNYICHICYIKINSCRPGFKIARNSGPLSLSLEALVILIIDRLWLLLRGIPSFLEELFTMNLIVEVIKREQHCSFLSFKMKTENCLALNVLFRGLSNIFFSFLLDISTGWLSNMSFSLSTARLISFYHRCFTNLSTGSKLGHVARHFSSTLTISACYLSLETLVKANIA